MTTLITGSNGLLGTAISDKFLSEGANIIPIKRVDLDLRNSQDTFNYFSTLRFDSIIHCAAVVGGIKANMSGGVKFFLDNHLIDSSVLNAARRLRIKRLIYIGSSCMYPTDINRPLKESDILNGRLETTNENYALAKIFGTHLTKSIAIQDNLAWRVFITSNLYGPFDHFDVENSHLIASVISKIVNAKRNNLSQIEMWGDGTPKREFTYISDFAEWIFSSVENLQNLPLVLNVGSGDEYSVHEYYEKISQELNWKGKVLVNSNIPNGSPRKLLDSTHARNHGWRPKMNIENGIRETIKWYLDHRTGR
jgi:GDP-L-fucose synthase